MGVSRLVRTRRTLKARQGKARRRNEHAAHSAAVRCGNWQSGSNDRRLMQLRVKEGCDFPEEKQSSAAPAQRCLTD